MVCRPHASNDLIELDICGHHAALDGIEGLVDISFGFESKNPSFRGFQNALGNI